GSAAASRIPIADAAMEGSRDEPQDLVSPEQTAKCRRWHNFVGSTLLLWACGRICATGLREPVWRSSNFGAWLVGPHRGCLGEPLGGGMRWEKKTNPMAAPQARKSLKALSLSAEQEPRA